MKMKVFLNFFSSSRRLPCFAKFWVHYFTSKKKHFMLSFVIQVYRVICCLARFIMFHCRNFKVYLMSFFNLQSKMQARHTKNSSMMLNLSFWLLAVAALFKTTPFCMTRDATIPLLVTQPRPLSFFHFVPREFFLECRFADLENLEMLIPCGGFWPRLRVLMRLSHPAKWSGRLQPP